MLQIPDSEAPVEFFKSIFEYLIINLPGHDWKKLLKQTDNFGSNFIKYIFKESRDPGDSHAACAIFNWLKLKDEKLLMDLIINKNFTGETIFHDISLYSKKQVVVFNLAKVFHYSKRNIPNFDWLNFLKQKDHFGQTFLDKVFIKDDENKATKAAHEIRMWLYLINSNRSSYFANFCCFLYNTFSVCMLSRSENHEEDDEEVEEFDSFNMIGIMGQFDDNVLQ